MITHELASVWITSDGKKFLDKAKAEEHEKLYQREKDLMEHLKRQWESGAEREDDENFIKQSP